MSQIFPLKDWRETGIATQKTVWLILRDSHQRKLFEKFKCDQTNVCTVITMVVIASVYLFFNKLIGMENYPSVFATTSFVLGGAIFPVATGIVIIYFRLLKIRKSNQSTDFSACQRFLKIMDCLWAFGTSMAFNIQIVLIAYNNGICPPGKDFVSSQGCNLNLPHQMPEGMMMLSLMLPVIFSVTVKNVQWNVVCFSFFATVFTNVFTMYYYDLTDSLPPLVMFTTVAVLLIYENERQQISLFLLTQSQQNLLELNKKLAEEAHATEMRHMIGNVAHDLKTPLSAFVAGMDLIASVLSEPALSTGIAEDKAVSSSLSTIRESVDHMTKIHQFMLMTINRCIDYTKASNNVKLVPRLETISLIEALLLPLNCMKDLQQDNKTEIKLLPMSIEICALLITDKQWLQENILCLLSNAVKFSLGGVVSLNVVMGGAIEESDPSTDFIRIEVEDAGIGIAEEMRTTLFMPFKQAQRLTGGTGLGLYSLAKRVESLGGYYGINARRDGEPGSLVWFSIPYRPDFSTSSDNSEGAKSVGLKTSKKIAPTATITTATGSTATATVLKPALSINTNITTLAISDKSNDKSIENKNKISSKEVVVSPTTVKYNATNTNINNNNNNNNKSDENNNMDSITISPNNVTTITTTSITTTTIPPKPGKLNILLVDDSISILKMSSMMLRRQGHSVVTAENGAIALQLMTDGIVTSNIDTNSSDINNNNDSIKANRFDVVLMDLQMPVMDGLESTSRLRKLETSLNNSRHNSNNNNNYIKLHDTTNSGDKNDFFDVVRSIDDEEEYGGDAQEYHQLIIGVSACSDNETIDAAFAAGIDAFIPKPFNMQSFNETYSSLLVKFNKTTSEEA